MTTDELLALPRNGCFHWLVRGQLRQKPIEYNRNHSSIMARLAYLLEEWLETQAMPRGQNLCGDAGCRLARDPDTTIGVDVMYVAAETMRQQSDAFPLVEGSPTLAIEILSPKDQVQEIDEKLDAYLHAGVALVWIIDPHDRTVTIYRANTEPELVNVRQELTAEPHLPGFRVAVAEIFA